MSIDKLERAAINESTSLKLPFLSRLTIQFLAGATLLPDDFVRPHREYVLSRQNEDGGWSGRDGGSDLYYTGFALRTLAILGELHGDVAARASTFLQTSLHRSQSIVDLISLIYGGQLIAASCDIDPFAKFAVDWPDRVIGFFETLRRDDGGFAKSPDSRLGSSYQTFLVVLCRELLERPLGPDDPCVAFLRSQHQTDGGFLEVRVAKRSGTNPTAAAAVALHCLVGLDNESLADVCQFLLDMQTEDGGFMANQRMPVDDLLSTFTALVTLWELERITDVRLASAMSYVKQMSRVEGGFAGFALDPAQDVEYTFYGLGAAAMIAASL
jgi:geranylgeranyl transferase type-2 subunit beta